MLTRAALIAILCSLTTVAAARCAVKPIADEPLRVEALKAVFPKTAISIEIGRTINDSWGPGGYSKELSFPDALATETVYRVVGPASGRAESCAASDVTDSSRFSDIREVRLRVFPWPASADPNSLLAVIQYNFPEANPPQSCTSIARLCRLTNSHGKWREVIGIDLDTTHHTSLQRIEMADLAGNRCQELLVESDWGAAGVAGSDMEIYSLARGGFDQWLNVPSRIYEPSGGDTFVQRLDLPATRRAGARRFCFQRITFAHAGRWLARPTKTRTCFPRLTGEPVREQFSGSER